MAETQKNTFEFAEIISIFKELFAEEGSLASAYGLQLKHIDEANMRAFIYSKYSGATPVIAFEGRRICFWDPTYFSILKADSDQIAAMLMSLLDSGLIIGIDKNASD